MTNTFNEYLKGATTPPPPPLKTTSTEYQDLKNNSNLTTEQYVNFDENMDRLNTILSRVEALVGLAKENPAVLIECSNLMRAAADIDLPPEIKNHKIATYPSVVQEMYKQASNTSPSNAVAQAVKQDNINMQIQQNLAEMRYGSLSYVQPLDAISSALNSNQPVTTEMICKHCQNMSIMNNSELNDLDYGSKLLTAFMNARTPEERAIVDAKMRKMYAHAKKRWGERKVWHGSTRQLLNSDRDISAEDMKRIVDSLREEEKVARRMLQIAKELEEAAKRETDPEQRKRYLELAAHARKGGYEILAENKATMQAFNRRVRGRSNQSNRTANQSTTTNESSVKNYTSTRSSQNEESETATRLSTNAGENNQSRQAYNRMVGDRSVQTGQSKSTNNPLDNLSPEELKQLSKNAQKQWTNRKNWHNSLNVLFDSGVDITHEQMQTIHASLKEEEKVAKQMLQRANELRELAEKETDPQKRNEMLGMADYIEKGSSEILSHNTKTMQAYDRKLFGTKIPTVSYDKDNIFSQSQPNQPLTLNFANKKAPTYSVSINPFQEKNTQSKTEERKDWHKKTRETLSSSKELSTDELQLFDKNLKQEADRANTFLKTADEFKMKAEKETNPQKKADWLNISDSLETKAYDMLFENQSSRIVYNQKTKAYDQQEPSATNGVKTDTSAETKGTSQQTEQTNANKSSEQKSAQPKNDAQQKEPTKPAEKNSSDKEKETKTAEIKAQQPKQTAEKKETNEKESTVQEPETPKEQPLTLTLNRFGQSVVLLDDENNTQTNPYDYSAYTIW